MREYKIIPSDLWYNIYRKRELEGWMIEVQFLNCYGRWSTYRKSARTFYNQNDALSTLVIMKSKWEKQSV